MKALHSLLFNKTQHVPDIPLPMLRVGYKNNMALSPIFAPIRCCNTIKIGQVISLKKCYMHTNVSLIFNLHILQRLAYKIKSH